VWAAAASGTTGVLLELIAAGADVNSNNKFGRSPLQAAAAGGHCETVLLLIAAGAELDACDDDGETALYAAAFENHPATVVALVSSGCCVDGGVVDDGGLSVTECPYESISSETPNAMGSPSLTKKLSIGKTHGHSTPPPLVGACWRGNAAAVAALLADGPGEWPDLERVTDDGRTALTASCWRGHHHCVKLLLGTCIISPVSSNRILPTLLRANPYPRHL
jgi:ankyrin repeat protein